MQEEKVEQFKLREKASVDPATGQESLSDEEALEATTLKTPSVFADVEAVVGGRYEVLELIGEGGMGSVYKVRQIFTGRIEVVKLLSTKLKSGIATARFQREAKAACAFSHPNAVAVYDFGVSPAGQPYMAMEYVPGLDLTTWRKQEEEIDQVSVVQIASEVCAALSAAHKAGVIHRDVKPSNIIVNKGANDKLTVKVVDFGIAKILNTSDESNIALTSTGEIFGSPLYMSPEQCEGRQADARSDVYSLGCVMYELLCGRPPHVGENALATIYNRLKDEPQRFQDVCPNKEFSPALERIVLKSLAKDPSERFQSMEELRSALMSVNLDTSSDEFTSSRFSEAKEISGRPRKRTVSKLPLLWVVPFSVLMLILILLFGPTSIFQNQNSAENQPKVARVKAKPDSHSDLIKNESFSNRDPWPLYNEAEEICTRAGGAEKLNKHDLKEVKRLFERAISFAAKPGDKANIQLAYGRKLFNWDLEHAKILAQEARRRREIAWF